MDFSQFDALANKVERAVSIIDGLKQEREHLQSELHAALERAGNLEKINLVGERIRDLVGRLDTALA